MAYPIQQSVADFHHKFGHPVRETPQNLEEGEAVQAYGFIEEELMELWDALYPHGEYNPNLVESADALGDIIVTAFGFGHRIGVDMSPVLAEIMRANMSKTPNGMGKIRKGPEYVAPDVAGVIAAQK